MTAVQPAKMAAWRASGAAIAASAPRWRGCLAALGRRLGRHALEPQAAVGQVPVVVDFPRRGRVLEEVGEAGAGRLLARPPELVVRPPAPEPLVVRSDRERASPCRATCGSASRDGCGSRGAGRARRPCRSRRSSCRTPAPPRPNGPWVQVSRLDAVADWTRRPGLLSTAVIVRLERVEQLLRRHPAAAGQHQVLVVDREPLAHPQHVGHVRPVVVERPERNRPDPLHVVVMEVLVGEERQRPNPARAIGSDA